MKKTAISIILALLMLSSTLISCNSTAPSQTDTSDAITTSAPDATTTEPADTETTIPELPEMNFEGEEYVILYSARPDEGRFNDFTADEAAATVLDEAVFKRNEQVNEKYNFTVSTI